MNRFNYVYSSDLYKQPSFMKGVARVFDLYGSLDTYNDNQFGNQTDAKTLQRDWMIVGQDLFHAIKAYGRTRSNK